MIVGIGIDIVEIDRIRQTLDRQGARFTNRIFTEAEQAYCTARRDTAPHYAARFAAKEALMKALGTGWSRGVRWRDIEVRREKGKAPTLVLHGEAEKRSIALGTTSIYITLSHSQDSAVACVILEK